MIVYLHGFRSSPHSTKATMLAQACMTRGWQDQYVCPQLPVSPAEAMTMLTDMLMGCDPGETVLIGSSLGGFYATALAERIGCRAVLLNPAVYPMNDLAAHVGMSTAWHSDTPHDFKASYLDELQRFAVNAISRPERYLLIAAKGDEVIDWRDMVDHYCGARQIVIEGSDHALSDFQHYLPAVLDFCL